jgi:hypothetical protein
VAGVPDGTLLMVEIVLSGPAMVMRNVVHVSRFGLRARTDTGRKQGYDASLRWFADADPAERLRISVNTPQDHFK